LSATHRLTNVCRSSWNVSGARPADRTPDGDALFAGGSGMVQVARHEHYPIVVVDDLKLDREGQPACWLWHVECLGCGENLPDVEVEADGHQLAAQTR
jgi:hypothetical protein